MTDGRPFWAKALLGDALGGAVAERELRDLRLVRQVTLLDKQGGPVNELSLGEKLRARRAMPCIDVGAGRPGARSPSNRRGVEALDPNTAAPESFLLAELGKLDEPVATKTLTELASSEQSCPRSSSAEARKLISTRREGVEYMLTALERHTTSSRGTLRPRRLDRRRASQP